MEHAECSEDTSGEKRNNYKIDTLTESVVSKLVEIFCYKIWAKYARFGLSKMVM